MLDKLLEFIREWIALFYFVEVVEEYEQGIVLRFGRFHRVLVPGWHFHWPLGVERAIVFPVTTDTQDLGEQSLTTRDGIAVIARAMVTYTISDIQIFILRVQSARQALVDSAMGAIGGRVAQATWAELREATFLRAVEIEVRRRAKRYGIEVSEVQWVDLTRAKSLRIWNSSPPKEL